MSMPQAKLDTGDEVQRMRDVLARQKAAHIKDGPPSAEKRIEWIDRAIGLLVGHKDAIADALREDFGHRSVQPSLFTDVSGSIGPLKHAKAHLQELDEAREAQGDARRSSACSAPRPMSTTSPRAWSASSVRGISRSI